MRQTQSNTVSSAASYGDTSRHNHFRCAVVVRYSACVPFDEKELTMALTAPPLVASHWTVVGPVRPFGESEVSPWPILDRIAGAAAAGFSGMGFSHQDLLAWADRIGFTAIAATLDEQQMVHREVEMLFDWWSDGDRRQASDAVREDLLRASGELGVELLKVGAAPLGEDVPLSRYVDEFGQLCEEFAAVGARVGIEFLPFSQVSTPEQTLEIIDGAGHDGGGLVVDLWHVARGGIDYSRVSAIPARRIARVELTDADATPIENIVDDTLDKRKLCGTGSFDIPGFIAAVEETGYAGAYGVEILSEVHRTLPLDEAARAAHDTAAAQFAATVARP
jgi:sugar phosphate isomerase/epimerase